MAVSVGFHVPKVSLGNSDYIVRPRDGKRKLKVQTLDSVRHPTEHHVRKAVEGQVSALNAGTLGGKVGTALGTIIDRHMAEDFQRLAIPRRRQTRASLISTSGQSGRACGWPM
jgi:hypothetical protein